MLCPPGSQHALIYNDNSSNRIIDSKVINNAVLIKVLFDTFMNLSCIMLIRIFWIITVFIISLDT